MYKEYSVAGVNMENRLLLIEEIINSAPEQVKVEIIPEPENPYDKNAKAVYVDAKKIGYIPKAETGNLPRDKGYFAVIQGIGIQTSPDNTRYAYCIIGVDAEDECYFRP